MNNRTFVQKHVFLCGDISHIINLVLNLIQKEVLYKEDVFLLFDNAKYQKHIIEALCESYNIDFAYYEENKSILIQPLTLNSLSLQPNTARIISDFLGQEIVTVNQVNILITDDEVDRWLTLYNTEDQLRISSSALIDDKVLKVLRLVNNYITPYASWGKPLEMMLGRKLNIIDAVLPFSVLDYKSQESLEAFLYSRNKEKPPSGYRILLFTKQQSSKKVFNIIKSYLSGELQIPSNLIITLGIWLPLNPKGFMLYMSLKAIIKLRKLPILLRLEQPVSSEQYALMLYEYDCLILQERGGFSTAKYFAENVGKLITLKNSFNDKTLNIDYRIQTFNSENYVEAIKDAISSAQKNEENNISKFASQLTKKHEKSFDTLRNYWNSFK